MVALISSRVCTLISHPPCETLTLCRRIQVSLYDRWAAVAPSLTAPQQQQGLLLRWRPLPLPVRTVPPPLNAMRSFAFVRRACRCAELRSCGGVEQGGALARLRHRRPGR